MVTPTTFYPSKAQVAPVTPPAPHAEWDKIGGAVSAKLITSRTDVGTDLSASVNDTSGTANVDVLLLQLVSDPIAAGPIAGTLHAQFLASQTSLTSPNLRSQIIVRVISGDGATVRGVLYAGDLETLIGTPTSEWGNFVNRAFPRGAPAALTPVAAQAGDRILVEVGYRRHSTSPSGVTGYVYYGARSGGVDLPENETATNGEPWIRFSDDLFTPRGMNVRAWILE